MFYLRDCFSPERIPAFRYGLFSVWVPKEVPIEGALPRFEDADEGSASAEESTAVAETELGFSASVAAPEIPITIPPTPITPVQIFVPVPITEEPPVHADALALPRSRPTSAQSPIVADPISTSAPVTPPEVYPTPISRPATSSPRATAVPIVSPVPSAPMSRAPSVIVTVGTPETTTTTLEPITATPMPDVISPSVNEPPAEVVPPPVPDVHLTDPDPNMGMAPLFYGKCCHSLLNDITHSEYHFVVHINS